MKAKDYLKDGIKKVKVMPVRMEKKRKFKTVKDYMK